MLHKISEREKRLCFGDPDIVYVLQYAFKKDTAHHGTSIVLRSTLSPDIWNPA